MHIEYLFKPVIFCSLKFAFFRPAKSEIFMVSSETISILSMTSRAFTMRLNSLAK